jgi:lipopolysaccharide/colanic/teichoic acid biosynthesis glycosyltransferase
MTQTTKRDEATDPTGDPRPDAEPGAIVTSATLDAPPVPRHHPESPERETRSTRPSGEAPGFIEARSSDPDWEQLDPRGWYPIVGKRALTVILLITVLPAALLLCIPISLVNWAIFRDRRRILYHQPRVGYHGRIFSIVKFRTMRETSQDSFDSWKEGQEGLRVTRFGRFLRNTHLDELPQLLNILRGEMDFIGPRPEMIEIYLWACKHVPHFQHRHCVLPGITGYAQITQGYTGMDERAYGEKLAADLHYIEGVSLRSDLSILIRTAAWMLRGRGWRWKGSPGRPAIDTRGESSAA